jgi:hypothetical protein
LESQVSAADAEALLNGAETGAAFAAELQAIKDDPDAVLAKARAAGHDVTRQERPARGHGTTRRS